MIVLWMRFAVMMVGTLLASGLCWAAVQMASGEKTMAPSVWGWFLGAGVGLFLATMVGVVFCIKVEEPILYAPPEPERPDDVPQERTGSDGGDADLR